MSSGLWFRELVDWVADATTGLGWSVDGADPAKVALFAGHRPEDAPIKCVTFYERGAGQVVSGSPNQQHPIIQVLTRGLDYWVASQLAQDVFGLIHSKAQGTELGSPVVATIESIIAMGVPGSIGSDSKGHHEFSTNYIVRYEQAA